MDVVLGISVEGNQSIMLIDMLKWEAHKPGLTFTRVIINLYSVEQTAAITLLRLIKADNSTLLKVGS